ncbi:hypothetical protein KAR91_13895 [Candidatus Pacearchaeota archaeon]|nr:hypothetical protein [Candidatus Pacearchaeota archaeon]
MQRGKDDPFTWEYLGALLAERSDEEQTKFIKSFLKECRSWGTRQEIEMQLAFINSKLTDDEKDLLGMLSYRGD